MFLVGNGGQELAEQAQYKLRLRFSGKAVEDRGLDLYDGAASFYGFAQAIQIVVHAYMKNEVVSKATALKGAEVYFGSPTRGSVVMDLIALIEHYPATSTLAALPFYDFIKFAFSKATGKSSAKAETSSVQKLAVDETFFDQLSETLEGSLQRAHRVIDQKSAAKVTLERPRSELITFDWRTSQWVHTRDENPSVEEMTGNVTRYNSISGNGRAFIREIGRIVPFRPGPQFPDSKRGVLTWSLHGDTTHTSKDLRFRASRIESAQGEAKRLILSDCSYA